MMAHTDSITELEQAVDTTGRAYALAAYLASKAQALFDLAIDDEKLPRTELPLFRQNVDDAKEELHKAYVAWDQAKAELLAAQVLKDVLAVSEYPDHLFNSTRIKFIAQVKETATSAVTPVALR